MKKLLRYGILCLLLCAAFRQAAMLRDLSPSVSLRFTEPISGEQAASFGAAWAEERGFVSGRESTVVRFTGDVQLVFPARWLYGTPPNGLMPDFCAVSTGLAWELFGGMDVTGLELELNGEDRIISGVFEHGEPVLLIPDEDGFTAAELFPVPTDVDPYRFARDRAAQAALPEPVQILCGPEGAAIAMLLPWLCVILAAWKFLRRRNIWCRAVPVVMVLMALPVWFIPTRWSDTAFWAELLGSLSGRFQDWMTVYPCLRDVQMKEAWYALVLTIGPATWAIKE